MPTPPPGYDPVLLNHWLWWKLKCFEAQGAEFQQLFERVMSRVRADFVPVRPYGNIGDRKNDGMCPNAGEVFGAYSPDEFTQAGLVDKIKSDLDGAFKAWKDKGLRRWVFVYNVRRGLAPDVAGILQSLKAKYPSIELDHLSSDDLWRMVERLPLQGRCELLGAPVGYEHLFLASSEGEAAKHLKDGAFVVIQDVMSPVNLADAVAALGGRVPFGPPFRAKPVVAGDDWEAAAAFQGALIEDALVRARELLPRFAVFSLSPISLAVHLGFLLSDRVEVEPFQFDRDRRTWSWPTPGAAWEPVDRRVVRHEGRGGAAVVRVSLSARVSPTDTEVHAPAPCIEADVFIANPDVTWLVNPAQLVEVSRAIRAVLAMCRDQEGCNAVHLFISGPTGAAIVIGQAVNPRMCPPVTLYEYARQREPRYRPSIVLRDGA